MERNKTSDMRELNDDDLACVSGGEGGNNNMLYGIGGLAVGAGAMALKKPETVVHTVEKIVHVPIPTYRISSQENQKLLDKVGEVKNIKQMTNINRPLSKEI
jgi:hypothetical protein